MSIPGLPTTLEEDEAFGALERQVAGSHYKDLPIQPVSIGYTRLDGMPLGRALRPLIAWYGDMELAPHLLGALASGPIEVTVVCHPPLSLSGEVNRKALARHAEEQVRRGLSLALHDPAKIG